MNNRKKRLYGVWRGMKQRCCDKNSISYKWYGERGIDVCDEWKHSFEAFEQWALSAGYDDTKSRKEQSLDRIDGSKGYSPDNCRFITHSENCRNTSRNVLITHNGVTKCVTEWCEELDFPSTLALARAKHSRNFAVIFENNKMAHRSNTGVKGISLLQSGKGYCVYAPGHKYIGIRKTIEEAVELLEGYNRGRRNP